MEKELNTLNTLYMAHICAKVDFRDKAAELIGDKQMRIKPSFIRSIYDISGHTYDAVRRYGAFSFEFHAAESGEWVGNYVLVEYDVLSALANLTAEEYVPETDAASEKSDVA